MKQPLMNISAAAAALLMMAATPAHAQSDEVGTSTTEIKSGAAGYWTAERFKDAKPFPIPQASRETAREAEAQRPQGKPASSEARPPSEQPKVIEQQLYTPDPSPSALQGGKAVEPGAVGSLGAPYTSTRVFPMFGGTSAGFSADR
ncbi:MAG: hypothetical protein JWQ01_4775, partial [Massilia sp.]|nr:hypothetical protein [Massilia sp.]